MTDKQIEALQAQIDRLKSSQPTVIDKAAEGEWRDRMHEIAEQRALRDAKSMYTRAELAAMQAAAPDDQVKAIALRDGRAPTGPSSQGIIPTSQPISNVRGPGSGWLAPRPIKNGLGQGR